MNYYNENDPKAAAWLRELIKAGHIPEGEVDERSVEDVTVSALIGYTQHHFFAGIGGWSLALKLAGWPDDRVVWTGSCPCQPFSAAGKRAGTSDERHLWPAFHWLIKQYRPDCVFGEQVASKDGIAWLDLVSTDMEGEGYAIAPIVFPACGVGAFHKRERLWFVGDSRGERARRDAGTISKTERETHLRSIDNGVIDASEGMADSHLSGKHQRSSSGEQSFHNENSKLVRMADPPCDGRVARGSESNWRGAQWYRCKDGKYRAIEPSVQPLAHGVPHRMGRLRGYGNAIVPQVAAQVIGAYMELRP